MNKHEQVRVSEIPKCDLCGKPARYDAKTKQGPWGYLCWSCFQDHGIGLGLGKGQELVLENTKGRL